jgi:hypothetical protein
VPVGGVYFRTLPSPLLRWALHRRRTLGEAVLGYHHPYDVDTVQRLTPPHFRRWGLYGLLIRANRSAVLPRLEMVRRMGFAFAPYGPFAAHARSALESR